MLASLRAIQKQGKPDVMTELLHLFLRDARHMLAVLREAVGERDIKALERTAHGLKGSSAILGLSQIMALSAELEQDRRDGWVQRAAAILVRLEQELDRVSQAFELERSSATPAEA